MNPSVLLCGLVLGSSMACIAPQRKAEFEADLRRWVGRPASEFILYKGNPMEVIPRPDGGRSYVFLTHRGQSNSKELTRFANANGTLSQGGIAMGSGPIYCRLILDIDATGTIRSTRWEGNDCW